MADEKVTLKKVLIITYYWPPSGGVGVQRWLKFAKYLPDWGWEPIILTPSNPAFDLKDSSLIQDVRHETEVLKIPIWEPYSLVEKLSGKKGQQNLNRGMALEGGKKGILSRLFPWMRGNLFIPDPRVFWVRPATEFAMRILESNHIEAIITTGPPHSVHLIGRKLREKSGLPWIADFRDPWTKWEVLHRMQLSTLAMKLHQSLERKVLTTADLVLTATPGLQEDLDKLGARLSKTVLNGVDHADLPAGYPDTSVPDKFRIVYVGLMNEKRNPPALWEALDELCARSEEFRADLEVSLTGSISAAIQQSLTAYDNIKDRCVIRENVSHQEVFNLYQSAAVLLLLVEQEAASRIVIPAKLYEYMTAQKPVLYIGDPTNGAGEIIEKENAGGSFYHHEKEKIRAYVWELFEQYRAGNIVRRINYQDYLRKNQVRIVADSLDRLTAGREE